MRCNLFAHELMLLVRNLITGNYRRLTGKPGLRALKFCNLFRCSLRNQFIPYARYTLSAYL